jgi:hypothetical protein
LDEETRERSSHAPPAYWDDHGEAVAEIGALSEPLAQVITAMECGLCDIPTQVAVLAAVASEHESVQRALHRRQAVYS